MWKRHTLIPPFLLLPPPSLLEKQSHGNARHGHRNSHAELGHGKGHDQNKAFRRQCEMNVIDKARDSSREDKGRRGFGGRAPRISCQNLTAA